MPIEWMMTYPGYTLIIILVVLWVISEAWSDFCMVLSRFGKTDVRNDEPLVPNPPKQ